MRLTGRGSAVPSGHRPGRGIAASRGGRLLRLSGAVLVGLSWLSPHGGLPLPERCEVASAVRGLFVVAFLKAFGTLLGASALGAGLLIDRPGGRDEGPDPLPDSPHPHPSPQPDDG